ncbi:hypothetical protein GCM10023205_83950 [Yinghuangia aomiensis]|uniref:Peptidoglycan binding domain-containing protein n=1 Tax=Yinghuangia aomiensis TaxID=676205 RepID=A0ABP9IGQ6_9ACTN
MNKPRRTLALILGAVVVVGAGGWYAGQQVQSPAEAAAAHQAPPASLITVPVESRVLTNSVVTHGTISFESPMPVNLSGAVGTAAPGGGTGDAGGGPQRVTRAPGAGASVAEGTVFMEVSGRPVFVLRGAVPMYRTLGPGTKGADVKQLNEALKRVGFDPGTSGESFTNGTATALKNWYRARGYDAKEPGTEDRHRLATLEQAVQAATDALTQARSAQRTPSAGSPGSTPSGGTGSTGGDGGKSGGAAGSTGGAGGSPPVDAASLRQRVANAEKALQLAQQDLTDFKATYGTSLPVGELVFVASLPVRVDQVNVRPGDTPSGPVATVTGTGVRIQATVPGVDAQLLKPGMAVVLEDEAGGSRHTGKVEALGAGAETPAPGAGQNGQSGQNGQNGQNGDSASGSGGAGSAPGGDAAGAPGAPVPVRIAPDDTSALSTRAGTSLRVTVEVGSTGTPVLAVPVASVYTGADGQARVKVQRGNGKADTVAVALGLSASGFVAVNPAAGQQLAAGDRVVVGEK